MTFSCNYLLPSSFTAPESGPQLVVHRTVLPKSVQRLSQPSTSLMRISYHFQLCIFIGTKMKKKREMILTMYIINRIFQISPSYSYPCEGFSNYKMQKFDF